MSVETHCPLCGIGVATHYCEDVRRPYMQCGNCRLVFVPSRCHLTLDAERAEYDLHQNEIHDPGYRHFLSRLYLPLRAKLQAGARGLDFGCGPGPALAHMFGEAGFEVTLYDSYYFPDAIAFEHRYDFICTTEVVEHLHKPGHELQRLWQCLNTGGWLGVMTKLVRDVDAFADWHYKNDPTHVCFFSEDTWRWWAHEQCAGVEFVGTDVILLQKPE